MARTSVLRAQIWAMEPGFTLQDIRGLQAQEYYEEIDYLVGRYDLDITEDDRTLLHSWTDVSEIDTYFMNHEAPAEIQYYTATAIFEHSVPRNHAFLDVAERMLLPRHLRITQSQADVIFFEYHERVYVIVYGTSSSFQVRTILMGGGNKNRRREEWGAIEQALPQYRLGSDFFYWLFNKQGSIVDTDYMDIDVTDVEGIGRFSDRLQHKIRGKGPNSTNELSNKTALGINQLVYESDFNFVMPDLKIYLCLGAYSDCIIDLKRTLFIDPGTGDLTGVRGHEVEFFLRLYAEILPGLIATYHREQNEGLWTPALAHDTSRQWALEVIDELARHHGLEQHEVNNIPWFVEQV